MTTIELTTSRPAVCFQLEKINQMTAIASRNLVSDLSIFDCYADAKIETDHYIDGWLVQLHVKIDKVVLKTDHR